MSNFFIMLGGLLFAQILKLMSGGLQENHALTRGNVVATPTCTRTEQNTENLDRFGRSQDLPVSGAPFK
jgi:hypothetical protein